MASHASFVTLNDLDTRDGESENLTLLYVLYQLNQLEMENSSNHVGTIGGAQVAGDVFLNLFPLGIARKRKKR